MALESTTRVFRTFIQVATFTTSVAYSIQIVNHTKAVATGDIPQFVSLSIDDALHETNGMLTSRIPNVKWTFFVSVMNQPDGWKYDPDLVHVDCVTADGHDTHAPGCLSKADVVREKYAEGHEIALHTYTHPSVAGGEHPLSEEEIMLEIDRNVQYLVDVGVSLQNITGFRAPFLDTQSWGPGDMQDLKNAALRMLQVAFNKNGIRYDSTFTAEPDVCHPRPGVRHCTATQGGWQYASCSYDERSKYDWPPEQGGYPFFERDSDPAPTWHSFLNRYYWDGKPLSSMDQVHLVCLELEQKDEHCTIELVKSIYRSNFDRSYHSDRAPFLIPLHGSSLMTEVEVSGLNAFLDEVRVLDNVKLATQGEVMRYYEEQLTR